MRSKPESSIVLLIIVIAIILALGVFLLVSVLWERSSDTVEPTAVPEVLANTIVVNGQTITLFVDPNQQPLLLEPTAVPPETQPEAAQSEEGEQQEQSQPEAAQSEQTNEQTQPAQGFGGQPGTRLTFIDYTVKQGDTLYRIQDEQRTSIALMAKHGIDANDIVVGNVLRLPVGNDAACNGWRTYVVLKGDTSFGISQRSGISLEEFRARNGLDANYSIYETDIVCIP